MKAYCFSDFHNDYDLLPEMAKRAAQADLVICAGDPTIFEFDLEKTLHEFNKWKKPMLLIHGNHEDERSMREACARHHWLEFVHGEERVIKGVRMLFWGGGGFSKLDKALEEKTEQWKTSKHAKLPTILVTHAPPHGTALDELHGRHVGNKTIMKAIKELKPRYAVSGHIHEAEGAEDKVGMTTCYNLGPLGKVINVTNDE